MIKLVAEKLANLAYRHNKVNIGHFWAKLYHSC